MNGKATTTRTRLERGRSALGPALELVHTGRAPTRAVLTAELGVTRATAGAVAAELEALGLIQVDSRPAAAGSQGRPSHRLAVNDTGPVALAAQVHADGYRAALVGLGGEIVATDPGCVIVSADPAQVLGEVVDAGAALLKGTGRRCVGAGLAVPSAVAEPEGTALNPLHLAWPAGSPVREIFAERVRAAGITGPAFTGNDVNLAALAEHRHGAGRGAQHLLCVATGHRGVGGALVLDGRLHSGSSGLALEVGHLTVNPDGRPCYCGSRGCLDVEADPLAFLTAAGRTPGPRCRSSNSHGPCCATSTRTSRSGTPPRDSSTGSASASPDSSTSSTPTGSSSAACTRRSWRRTRTGCGPSWPTAACGAGAAASRSSPAPSTTTAWSARPSWPGSRCSTTRSARSLTRRRPAPDWR